MICLLNNGVEVQVDKQDAHLISEKRWLVNSTGYVVASHGGGYLHKLIMPSQGKLETDHINQDKLDNRRSNLRIVTRNQNAWNQKPYKGRKYKGVFKTTKNTFQVKVAHMGKQFYLGTFKSEDFAAEVYNDRARELHGEYAVLNEVTS